FKQLTTAALRTAPHDYEQISLNDIIADREGYILAYLSNENAEEVAIHWDDFTVYHGKTNVVQAQNFYPFGLQFGEYQRTASTPQRYLFNQGIGAINFPTERIFELDVDMTKHRVYDYVLGRFWQVDPLANVASQESWTSYHYALNNPILYSDPYGDCPKCWKGLKRLFWDPIVKTRKWTVKKQAVYGTPTRTQLGKNITGNYLGDAAFHLLGGPIFQRALDGDHRAQGQLIMGGLLALHPGSRSQFKSSGIVNKLINDADNASDLMFIVGKKGDDVTRYLDVQGAEAAFMAGDESTILLREGASIETVTEEIIHFNQFKKHGEKYFLKNRTKLEIEAQDHLLKIGKDEGWSDKVMERIRNAKESWQQLLEKETQNGGS
ncbi:MAG: RHS repeat-associated core domain-containing protein, partial [Bacteroidota bacterium]